jgi:tRNA 2-selenouridine synthase
LLKTPQVLSIDDFLNGGADRGRAVIDVRTPAEFALDHLPGAVNLPVLGNEERVLVGTINRESGSFDANVRGATLVAANIAALLAGPLADKPRTWSPLVYCWRGGSRSWSLATVLARVGWRVALLDGGYRSYRQRVVADLETLCRSFAFKVLAGPTGSGKTRVLQLAAEAGAQVLDLEALARHRGSVLGSVPDAPQPSQKAFDAMLWRELRAMDPSRPVLVESESRKIGQLHLPETLIGRMRASPCIRLDVPVDVRIRLLRDQYPHLEADHAGLKERLDRLVPLYSDRRVDKWLSLADAGRWDELVGRLLLEHYDPAYLRSMYRNYGRVAEGESICMETCTEEALAGAAQALVDRLALDGSP